MPPFTLTRAQVRSLDHQATVSYGLSGLVLMENAGRGCAELLINLNPEKKPTVILCGPGNNGGDGFVVARLLAEAGWRAEVQLFAPADRISGDATVNLNRLFGRIEVTDHRWMFTIEDPNLRDPLDRLASIFSSRVLVVDALFGTGLSRPLIDPYSEVVGAINASQCPVLAIDIPSGLDCDTGEPLGPTVRATHTATFVAPKRGFLNPASKAWTGEVHVIDIGAPRKLVDEYRS